MVVIVNIICQLGPAVNGRFLAKGSQEAPAEGF